MPSSSLLTHPALGFPAKEALATDRLSPTCFIEFERERARAREHVFGKIAKGSRCLFVPMGGGGDCIGTYLAAYEAARYYHAEVAVVGLTLKRPSQTGTSMPLGCLPLSAFDNQVPASKLSRLGITSLLPHIGFVTEETLGPNNLLVDEVRLLAHCRSSREWKGYSPLVGLLDPTPGVTTITHELRTLLREGGFSHVFFVDVGGDVITEGAEEDKKTLWSPVLDQMMNHVATRLARELPTRTLVTGLGGDGEITHERYIAQHNRISNHNGFHGGIAVSLDAVQGYRELLQTALTETSRQILVALNQILVDADLFGQFASVQTHLNHLVTSRNPKIFLEDLFLWDIPVALRNGIRKSSLNVLTPYLMSYDPGTVAKCSKFNWLSSDGNLTFTQLADKMRGLGYRTELDNPT